MRKDMEAALYGLTRDLSHAGISVDEVSGCTIGGKMMDREYNGLGVASDESIERFNDLIDRLIYYMDEGDTVTITGVADREFNVVIESTRIRGKRNE